MLVVISVDNSAIILCGFQNDSMSKDGVIRQSAIDPDVDIDSVVENTVSLIKSCMDTSLLVVNTPIIFTSDYSEVVNPVGILKAIKDLGAFQMGTQGASNIAEIDALGERVITLPGKRGMNSFSNTQVEDVFRENNIHNVIVAGIMASLCIDTTARYGYERGFNMIILEDCVAGRSQFEKQYYCEEIFPMYATLQNSQAIAEELLQSTSKV